MSTSSAESLYKHIGTEGTMDNNDRIWIAERKNNAAWDRLMMSADEVRRLYQNARLAHQGPWRNS